MRSARLALLLLASSLLLLSSGCGDDRGPGPPVDAGMVADGGGTDTGVPPVDGGTPTPDAGPPDAGPTDRPEDYPEDPYGELSTVSGTPVLHQGMSTFGDGAALFTVWAPPTYTREERWPLIVYLHGGGNTTDTAMSLTSGAGDLRAYVRTTDGDRFIWMAPVVRVSGSYHAWAMEQNALDIIDGIREVSRLFRVDDARVYLTGTSMGGGGVATLSWVIPDAFAAYAPAAGYYWNDLLAAPDLSDVPYRVIAGALDTPPMQPFDRLGLAREFAGLCEAAGAAVELVVLDGVGHSYPSDQAGLTNAFFLSHARTDPTDWELTRAEADAILPLFTR